MSDYFDIYNYVSTRYSEVSGIDFYGDIFPNCEKSTCLHTDFSTPNAIFLYQTTEGLRRRIMYQDTFISDYNDYVYNNPLTLCSGLSYVGRENKLQKATKMNALIFDLDSVGLREFLILEKRWNVSSSVIRSVPKPTYVVLSGSGVHLYYLFSEPILLYPNIKIQLKSLKYDLTYRIWDFGATSKKNKIQYQSINQGFRMVGSINSKYSDQRRVLAFRVGNPITINYLNKYVIDKNNIVDLQKPFSPTSYTKQQAKVMFPDWYERVIVRGDTSKKKWDINKKVNGKDPYALYHWWIRQANKISGGHRYYFLMCMAIYADKCNVPLEILKKDMKKIFEQVASIPHDNQLTEEDMASALEAYSKEYYDTTIDTISYWTAVNIEKNKRNGLKQSDHIKLMNFVRDELNGNKNWRAGNGRKPQKKAVLDWRANHPEGKKADCIRDTGLSKPTVYRWWDSPPIDPLQQAIIDIFSS